MTHKECKYCKKEFVPTSSNTCRGRGIFCSPECYWESLRITASKKCESCNTEFYKQSGVSISVFNEKRFCSLQCFHNIHKKKRKKGIESNNWKGGVSKDARRYYNSRRERVFNSIGRHTPEEWLALKEKFDFLCLMCYRKEPEIKLTRDHIIPLSLGGGGDIENIQPLCKNCNSKKHTDSTNYKKVFKKI